MTRIIDKTTEEVQEYFDSTQTTQCAKGIKWISKKIEELKPSVYLEVGCAKGGLVHTMSQLLVGKEPLAIGVDAHSSYRAIWESYSPCKFVQGLSGDKETIESVSKLLGDRKVDVLFIDGDHSRKGVQEDWDNYKGFVKPGGMVIFHDWSFEREKPFRDDVQGAGILCWGLVDEGWTVHSIPDTKIGTAYLYMPEK